MSDKKYVSLDRLTGYDFLIKQTIADSISAKADKTHNHNDIYYTESEINTKISTINTSISNITNGTTKVAKATSADSATSATSATKAAQDGNGKVISSTYETKYDASAKLVEAKTYADSAAAKVKNDLLNNAGSAYDTLKELGDLIDDNTDAISALEAVAAGKANASHTHTIADVYGLQSALDGKAASNHGTHVTYSSTSPVMDGTASVGSASTVARSDHKHPTDTSRASQADLDALETVVSGKANTSHTHSISNVTNLETTLSGKQATITGGASTITGSNLTTNRALVSNGSGKVAVSTATSTELGYLSGVTSSIQTQLDDKATASHTHSYAGSASAGGAATSANKVNKTLTVQLNGGTTEGTNKFTFDGSAAKSINITPSSIGASASSHTHDDLYYTEAEVDSKLSGKANSSHGNHVPTTQTANNATFLRNDNTWQKVTPTNIGAAASSHTHTIANITDLTATATELNYMDGVTSNVQTQLDSKSSTSHTHKYAGSSSVGGSATSAVKLDTDIVGDSNTPVYFSGGKPVACTSLDLNTSGSSASCTGNSATATKLQTARTIGLGTGVTGTATSFDGGANITVPVTDVKEAYLSWGGKNLSGSITPIDAACSNIHSANRFAFAKPAGITVEYSTNGSTYSAYSTTDSAKINLVSGNGNTYYIGARSTSTTVNDKLRITLNATNMGLYTRLRKLLINISTSYATGSNVIIEKAMKGSETTFSTIGTYQISGWSGWNSIPINSAFGGGDNQTGNIAVLRLTFSITGVNTAQTSNALSVSDIIGIGDTYWSHPSTMAKTGHIYSYDSSQNTTFPANVTATTFVGALSGNATTATTATKLGSSTVGGATQPVYINSGTATACTYTLGKSVPSNAIFTDQNVTNTLATTTKAYVTGTTSATTSTGTQVFDTGVYLDTTAGQLTATTFNGTTFSGSGVATLAEVKSYLGI